MACLLLDRQGRDVSEIVGYAQQRSLKCRPTAAREYDDNVTFQQNSTPALNLWKTVKLIKLVKPELAAEHPRFEFVVDYSI